MGLTLGVNLPQASAQDEPAREPQASTGEVPATPTIGTAVSVGATVDHAGNPVVTAPSGNSMMSNVRAAAQRMLETSPEALRRRTLDTSFPAEHPALEVPEPPREVVVPPPPADSPELPPNADDVSRGPSRRTVLRTINGVTVLTNVTDEVGDEARQVDPGADRALAVTPPSRAASTAGVALERGVQANVNALNPESKTPAATGLGVWLWVLTGFALVLLVPIAVLLTRPVRKG